MSSSNLTELSEDQIDSIILKYSYKIDLTNTTLVNKIKDALRDGYVDLKNPEYEDHIGYDGGGIIVWMTIEDLIDEFVKDINFDPSIYSANKVMYDYEQ